MFKKMYEKLEAQVDNRYASLILAALFFIEAIFFLPVDPVLMVYCLKRKDRAFYYAGIATAASVLGGICGYYIGYSIWETAGSWIVTNILGQSFFDTIIYYFKTYEFWAVLAAGFTPIPYKAVTLGAGFCQLPLVPFILCSILARGTRFYLEAGLMFFYGAHIKRYIDEYFNRLALLGLTLVILAFLFYKILR